MRIVRSGCVAVATAALCAGAAWGQTFAAPESDPGAPSVRPLYPPVSDFGRKAIRRMMRSNALWLHAFGAAPFAQPQAITNDLWNGGAGSWNVATNWSLGTVPNSSNNVIINNSSPAAVVQFNASDTINNLTIGSTSVLNINNSFVLTIDGTTITNSNKTGSGGLTLGGSGNYTELVLGGNVTLTGGGTVTLSNNYYNYVFGAAGSDVLTNANNTIQGSGHIGNGEMGLVNQGTIDANQSTPLYIQTSSGTTNSGTLEATAGGNLWLIGDTYTNTGGTILASGSGSIVTLQNPTINGGTLNTAGGGLIQANGDPTLNGVTNKGTYQLPNSNSTILMGSMTNNGSIQLQSSGNYTELYASGAVTLTGGGTVTMSDSFYNIIQGASSGSSLTNVNNTISGCGSIGNGTMGFTNQAAGVVDAVSSSGNYLTIATGSYGATNLGLMEASSGGTLQLEDTITNSNGTANGTIEALNGGTVLLNSTTISGGTLSTTGTGVVISENATLDSSTYALTTSSNLQVPNGYNLYINDTITNNGPISLNSSGNYTELYINSPTATLQGSGSITLSDSNYNYINATVSGDQLTIAQPITGPGGNIGAGDLVLVNQSTIDATKSASGNTLTLQPDGTFTNNGLVEATGGGSLALLGGTFANAGGTITAGTGSTISLEGGVTVVGGTLDGAGTYINTGGSTLDGSASALNLASTLQNPNGTSLYVKGTINNTGTIELESSGNYTELYINSPTAVLQGSGSITLSDSNYNYINATAGGDQLTIAQPITGPGGDIGAGDLVLVNQSTIDATKSASGNTLTLQPYGSFTNNGLVEATGGGSLALLGGTFANAGGTITAGTGSTISLQDEVTVAGGTMNGAGTYVNTGGSTLDGSANTLNLASTLQTANGLSLYVKGDIDNTGSIELSSTGNYTELYVNGNTTLSGNGTVVLSNSPYNYIQGVAGTEVLTSSNTIEGSGYIGNHNLGFVNNGTVLANNSTPLYIEPNSSGFTNNGVVQVNTGSLLDITGGPFNNFNGTTSTLTGGTYNVNGGTLQFDNANIVTNAANIILTGAGSQIVNQSNANALANFAVNAAAGSFTLGAGRSFTTAGNFTNNGRLTVGAGDVFKVSGNLTNFASNTLTGGTYNIAGILQFGATGSSLTTNAANLTLNGTAAQLLDLGGNNLLANFSTNASGGTFTVSNGGSFTTAGAFTNAGTTDLENGGTLKISGNLTNSGTVATNNTNQQGSANTLTVTGTLTNDSGAFVTIGANNDTTDKANVGTLTNSGTVDVDAGATLDLTGTGTNTNSGSILVSGGTLDMQRGSFTNSGDLDLEKTGTLTITGNLTNSGTLTTNGANLGGGANTLTVTGTLTNNSGDTVTIGANNDTSDTASVGILTNHGTVTIGTGATLALTKAGTDSNTGTIDVDGTLDIKAAATLSGAGTINLTNGAITGVGSGITLTNSTTIEGSGTISNVGLINTKTLLANQSAPLIILPTAAGLNNEGTISVSAGSTMQIGTSAGGALVNFASNTLTGGTYAISGTLQFGASGTTIATNAANITLTGAGQMIDFGGNNILAGFNNNASTGVFKLTSGASLTTNGGNFINAGLFTVSTGTTFSVGGSSFNYTQTAGTTTVDGTLTSTSLGTVSVDGGSLIGTGTVGDNLVDDGTLTPGTSSTKTGRLTVADTYTQESGGALDISIGGTTAGSKYDQLKVKQGAALGGTLNITLVSGFTPAVGATFTILTASSVSSTFGTVNGLAINSSEHFSISYTKTGVVLTVVSGPLPSATVLSMSQAVQPALLAVPMLGSASGSHYGPAAIALGTAGLQQTVAPGGFIPTTLPAKGNLLGNQRYQPMDASPAIGVIAPLSAPGSGASALPVAPAAAYNSMAAMNHMRFECGIDLKGLLKTSRKQLLKGLWAAPDSPNALWLGYVVFTGAH